MVDLKETLELVRQVFEKGLETSPMPEVAKGCGFSHASSTPFARRMAAARHFGLIGPRGAELTQAARKYFHPTEEGEDKAILVEAVKTPPRYADLIERYNNKKLNDETLKNWFCLELKLQKPAGYQCARAFILSLRFAGLVGPDEVLRKSAAKEQNRDDGNRGQPMSSPIGSEKGDHPEFQQFTLPLDKSGARVFIVKSPPTVTQQELKRIQEWLSFQLIVEDAT